MFPSGILTFLFTDIEGSTPLWEADPVGMAEALEQHNDSLRAVFAAHNGQVFKTVGDAFCVVFENPLQAVETAVAGQRALAEVSWGRVGPLQVRMGLHYGPAVWEDGDYAASHTFNRTARIMSCGHGGQILLSVEVVDQVRDQLPGDVCLRDLGRLQLKGMALREHLFQVVTPDLLDDFPPLKTEEAGAEQRVEQIPYHLPPPATPFIGRREELAQLVELIADPQTKLVTIVGPGGMGKTRLALAAAEILLQERNGRGPRFPHGVFFVALEALEAPEQIPAAVCSALGFRPAAEDPHQRSPWQQTVDYLHAKQLLLVMDNFEQLLDGVDLLVSLYHTAPQVTVLATSREKLALRGERLFPLQGLRYPTTITAGMDGAQLIERYSASRLFVERARRIRPDFALEADEVTDLAEICHLVGGMPLALELAAGWVELLSLGDIVYEIKRNLDILETEMHDVPQRQRSMTAVFEGSWRRLEQDEQNVLKKLSVFRGGFTRQAAQHVAGASLRHLASLSGKSLIHYEKGADRYQIHRLLRQYLLQQLAQDEAVEASVKNDHCAYYCAAVSNWTAELKGAEQRQAKAEMETESLNIESAWSWAVDQRQLDQLYQAVEGLVLFYARSGRCPDVEIACRRAVERLSGMADVEAQRVLAWILAWQGYFMLDKPDQLLIEQSIDLLTSLEQEGQDVRREKAWSLLRLGILVTGVDNEEAEKLLAKSLSLYKELNDTWGEAYALRSQARLMFWQGCLDNARHLYGKSLQLCSAANDSESRTSALMDLAEIALFEGDFEQAFELVEECHHIFKEDQDLLGLANAHYELAMIHFTSGQFAEARSAFMQHNEMIKELGLDYIWHNLFADFSEMMQGRYETASKYPPVEESQAESLSFHGIYQVFYLGLVALATEQPLESLSLLKHCVAICEEQNRLIQMPAALAARAMAHLAVDHVEEAANGLRVALQMTLDRRGILAEIYVLVAASLTMAALDRQERALEIYELALQYPYVTNAQLFEDIAGKQIAAAAASLPAEVVEAARQRGRALDPWQTLSELLAELLVGL